MEAFIFPLWEKTWSLIWIFCWKLHPGIQELLNYPPSYIAKLKGIFQSLVSSNMFCNLLQWVVWDWVDFKECYVWGAKMWEKLMRQLLHGGRTKEKTWEDLNKKTIFWLHVIRQHVIRQVCKSDCCIIKDQRKHLLCRIIYNKVPYNRITKALLLGGQLLGKARVLLYQMPLWWHCWLIQCPFPTFSLSLNPSLLC
jgi:hypothetical protein